MKTTRLLAIFILSILFFGCAVLNPVSVIKNRSLENFKYVYISPTSSLTSSSGSLYGGAYGVYGGTTSKSVNPADVISGILTKKGFIRLPELKSELSDETIIVNYGESGKRSTGLGGYTIEVTIQLITSKSNELISSCSAEGQGETEADDIRQAITRCLTTLFLTQKNESTLDNLNDKNDVNFISKSTERGVYFKGNNCAIHEEFSSEGVIIKCLNESGRAYDTYAVKKSELTFHGIAHAWQITGDSRIEESKKPKSDSPGLYFNGSPCIIIGEMPDGYVKIKYLTDTGRGYYRVIVLRNDLVEIK